MPFVAMPYYDTITTPPPLSAENVLELWREDRGVSRRAGARIEDNEGTAGSSRLLRHEGINEMRVLLIVSIYIPKRGSELQ